MNDTRREQLLDQYEDAALELLMDEYAEADGERLEMLPPSPKIWT